MLSIVKDHKDALVLENDFDESNDIGVIEFAAQAHLANGTLRDSSIADLLALLVRLKFLDGDFVAGRTRRSFAASSNAGAAYSLVDTAIGSTADESDDAISFSDTCFWLVSSGAPKSFYR